MKKIIIAGVIVGIIAGGMGAVMYVRSGSIRSPASLSSAEPTSLPVKLLTWDDPAGFTFQYPAELSVNKHDEDQENYSHVELAKAGQTGSIIVWAKDPPTDSLGTIVSDVAGWLKSDPALATSAAIDTALGKQPAKKVFLTSRNKALTGAVSDSTLWIVETNTGTGDYWQKTADIIIGSFAFKPTNPSAGADTGGDGGSIDEEEVVQ